MIHQVSGGAQGTASDVERTVEFMFELKKDPWQIWDDRPLKTQSLLATIYRQLGIDCEHVLSDGTGQRIPILRDAYPIEELVG